LENSDKEYCDDHAPLSPTKTKLNSSNENNPNPPKPAPTQTQSNQPKPNTTIPKTEIEGTAKFLPLIDISKRQGRVTSIYVRVN
jgi:hypothetical protein